jgi:hypothetical protein
VLSAQVLRLQTCWATWASRTWASSRRSSELRADARVPAAAVQPLTPRVAALSSPSPGSSPSTAVSGPRPSYPNKSLRSLSFPLHLTTHPPRSPSGTLWQRGCVWAYGAMQATRRHGGYRGQYQGGCQAQRCRHRISGSQSRVPNRNSQGTRPHELLSAAHRPAGLGSTLSGQQHGFGQHDPFASAPNGARQTTTSSHHGGAPGQ